jgi:uncharacterized protein (TIGR02118 family)
MCTMIKLTVLYGPPVDPAAFEDYYANTHLALAAKIPNARRVEASKVVATPADGEAPYHRIAELWFDSADQMQAALGSDEGRAVVEDIGAFATGGATVVVSALD